MPPIDARTAAIASGGILLVALGVVGLMGLDAPSRPATAPRFEAPAAATSLHSPPIAAPVHALPALPPAEPWFADDSTAVVARRYAEATDLREFYRRAVAAGGMANVWFAQAALLRCSDVSRGGMVGAEQDFASIDWHNDRASARREAHRKWIEPCRGFEAEPVPPGEIQRITMRLREVPGVVGDRYRLLLKSEPPSPEEWRAHLRAVVESGDPHVIAAFGSDAAHLRIGQYTYKTGPAAQQVNRDLREEQVAWTLAGCALGSDCGTGSHAWWAACAETGDCGDGNANSGAAAEVGAAAMPRVLRRRDEIVAAVRSRDWAALGL